MLITPQEIHVYISSIHSPPASINMMFDYLTIEEIYRYNRYLRQEDKLRFILGRYLLKTYLSGYYNIPYTDIIITYNNYGKPIFNHSIVDTIPLNFNISHSSDIVVIAFCSKTVGIDIEKILPLDADLLNDSILSKYELSYLQTLSHSSQSYEFYKIWTAKEAISKAIGLGVNLPFNRIQLYYQDEHGFIDYYLNNSLSRFYIYRYSGVPRSYSGCIATSLYAPTIKVFNM